MTDHLTDEFPGDLDYEGLSIPSFSRRLEGLPVSADESDATFHFPVHRALTSHRCW